MIVCLVRHETISLLTAVTFGSSLTKTTRCAVPILKASMKATPFAQRRVSQSANG